MTKDQEGCCAFIICIICGILMFYLFYAIEMSNRAAHQEYIQAVYNARVARLVEMQGQGHQVISLSVVWQDMENLIIPGSITVAKISWNEARITGPADDIVAVWRRMYGL